MLCKVWYTRQLDLAVVKTIFREHVLDEDMYDSDDFGDCGKFGMKEA